MVLNLVKKAFPGGFPLDGNLGSLAAYASVLALSIGISSLTHAHVELPGIRLGKSIVEKL